MSLFPTYGYKLNTIKYYHISSQKEFTCISRTGNPPRMNLIPWYYGRRHQLQRNDFEIYKFPIKSREQGIVQLVLAETVREWKKTLFDLFNRYDLWFRIFRHVTRTFTEIYENSSFCTLLYVFWQIWVYVPCTKVNKLYFPPYAAAAWLARATCILYNILWQQYSRY